MDQSIAVLTLNEVRASFLSIVVEVRASFLSRAARSNSGRLSLKVVHSIPIVLVPSWLYNDHVISIQGYILIVLLPIVAVYASNPKVGEYFSNGDDIPISQQCCV